jgi:hypothetical protein
MKGKEREDTPSMKTETGWRQELNYQGRLRSAMTCTWTVWVHLDGEIRNCSRRALGHVLWSAKHGVSRNSYTAWCSIKVTRGAEEEIIGGRYEGFPALDDRSISAVEKISLSLGLVFCHPPESKAPISSKFEMKVAQLRSRVSTSPSPCRYQLSPVVKLRAMFRSRR